MVECKYELRYLPLFYEDLSEKLFYIENVLNNPQAARQLLEDVERAILEQNYRKKSFDLNHRIAIRSKLWYDFQ